MKCETLAQNTDGSEALLDLHKFQSNDTGVQDEFQVFAGLGKSFKLEQYKKGIARTLKAIKFSQYEQEE